ncbi:DUF3826 domain-containing protein [Pelagicoccus albus]|uniref:DUF3826 domain-containing protein n=1 Tax=Pelagicoccus albus TaxID=415222 RepID=A0A7X1B9B8_9BACT|nr:DUF3826 domain-containing protein [Pelagicoccus albus]MBC2608069.1 DUF3826 domain-containing protein [Pelagicoccus albus]
MNEMKRIWIGVALLLAIAGRAQAEEVSAADQERYEKAASWVASLELDDEVKADRLTEVVATHLIAVRNWHNSHPADSVPAGINPKTGERLSKLDRSIIADSAMPGSTHEALMTGLRADLEEAQVQAILDKYTVGKVPFTMKAYRMIVPDLTEKVIAVLQSNLEQAREMAVDYKNMKQISAIFEIYKTKNEDYLNSNGRSWRQLYKAYSKLSKAEKEERERNLK